MQQLGDDSSPLQLSRKRYEFLVQMIGFEADVAQANVARFSLCLCGLTLFELSIDKYQQPQSNYSVFCLDSYVSELSSGVWFRGQTILLEGVLA